MVEHITRRRFLSGAMTGATAIGLLGKARETMAWPPGPAENVKRDLTPGQTAIRLATRMVRLKSEAPEETVRRIRDAGYTAVNTQPSQWSDAELVEMRKLLKQYDVTVFEVGAYDNLIHPDTAKRRDILKKIVTKFEDAEKIGGAMVATVSGSCDPRLPYQSTS